MYCTQCGARLNADEKICSGCGSQIKEQPGFVYPVRNICPAQTGQNGGSGILAYKTIWMLLGAVLVLFYLIKAFVIPAFNPPPYVPFNGARIVPQEIIGSSDFKVSAVKLDYGTGEHRRSKTVYLHIQNLTEDTLQFGCMSLCVNGVVVYPQFEAVVEGGSEKDAELAFDIDSLGRFHIDTIGSISLILLYRKQSEQEWKKTDLVTFETTLAKEASRPKLKENYSKIFKDDLVKIGFVGIKGYHAGKNNALSFYIENRGSGLLRLKGKNFRLNGTSLPDTAIILQGESEGLMHIFESRSKVGRLKPYRLLEGSIEVYTDKNTPDYVIPVSIKNPRG